MARIPHIDSDRTPETARVAEEIRAHRSRAIPNLYRTLLHSPAVCEGWLRLGTALRYESALEPRLRELVTCLVAAQTGSAYEWAHHGPLARAEGITAAQLAALTGDVSWSLFDDLERACLELALAVVRNEALPDDRFERVRAALGDSGVVELVALGSYYSGVARFLTALDVDIEDDLATSSQPPPSPSSAG
jgi:AhpD family alkylhydroperoxidase